MIEIIKVSNNLATMADQIEQSLCQLIESKLLANVHAELINIKENL